MLPISSIGFQQSSFPMITHGKKPFYHQVSISLLLDFLGFVQITASIIESNGHDKQKTIAIIGIASAFIKTVKMACLGR